MCCTLQEVLVRKWCCLSNPYLCIAALHVKICTASGFHITRNSLFTNRTLTPKLIQAICNCQLNVITPIDFAVRKEKNSWDHKSPKWKGGVWRSCDRRVTGHMAHPLTQLGWLETWGLWWLWCWRSGADDNSLEYFPVLVDIEQKYWLQLWGDKKWD